ncbi:MAG TPA: radical SAM protein [Bacteroidales bacterium]|nr:radical SAM protein [Bacteroidales bacterium]
MANLSITNVCNRSCPYCFANDSKTELGKTFMEDNVYEAALNYLSRSAIKQVRLLGGEPTLHPGFIKMVTKALERDFTISLFTNGLMPENVLRFLENAPEGKLSILLNTIHPSEGDRIGIDRQRDVMLRLGRVIILGINICSSSQKMEYLIDYVRKYNLKKEIRLGIAHTVMSKANTSLHPKEYQKTGYAIFKLKQEAAREGISIGFDCGFVPCMFPEEYYNLLSEELKNAGTCCHPVIDLLADGSFIACYPLNNLLKIKLNDQIDSKKLSGRFEEVLRPYNETGIYPHCSSCPLFKTRCNGGCMSFRIQRYTRMYDRRN